MSSPAVQLTFTLRTSPNVRTVHLLGSWDGYKSQLPLAALKDPAAKPGSWKGTFRFQGSHALKLGSRYWYYYIVDGYHVSHDPAKEFVTEKTTGRKLNVLDVPGGKPVASKQTKPDLGLQTRGLPKTPTQARHSREIPQGRALSPGKIVHPKPQKPYASQAIREADYDRSPVDDLGDRFASTRLSDRARSYLSSPSSLSDSSESSGPAFSSSTTSATSASATSESDGGNGCRCNRFGVTRDGRRVKLDCGGRKCGYTSSSSSECASSDDGTTSEEEDDSEDERRKRAKMRLEAERMKAAAAARARQGMAEDRRRAAVVDRRRR